MLDVALEFFKNELSAFLAARLGPSSVEVVLSRVVDENGKYALPEDSLGISLVNLEEERTFRAQLPSHSLVAGQHVVREPELKLNLFVLLAAHFKHYDQGLKHLSCALTYFQANSAFTPEQYPGLDPRIEKLTAELQSLNYEQLNQMWAYIGAKQLPSVVYRVRLVTLQDLELSAVQPPLTAVAVSLGST